jgi:hypothetical protein
MVLNDKVNNFCCGGLIATDSDVSSDAMTMNVGGFAALSKGDKVTIGIKHWSGSTVIYDWSVFSAVKVGDLKRIGFAVRHQGHTEVTIGHQNENHGWNRIKEWCVVMFVRIWWRPLRLLPQRMCVGDLCGCCP